MVSSEMLCSRRCHLSRSNVGKVYHAQRRYARQDNLGVDVFYGAD